MVTVPDRLWGEILLDEPVLEKLARSGPVQRLRGIHQSGASYYLFPDRKPSTRYEHSLGVMHLLGLLGASLEERSARRSTVPPRPVVRKRTKSVGDGVYTSAPPITQREQPPSMVASEGPTFSLRNDPVFTLRRSPSSMPPRPSGRGSRPPPRPEPETIPETERLPPNPTPLVMREPATPVREPTPPDKPTLENLSSNSDETTTAFNATMRAIY